MGGSILRLSYSLHNYCWIKREGQQTQALSADCSNFLHSLGPTITLLVHRPESEQISYTGIHSQDITQTGSFHALPALEFIPINTQLHVHAKHQRNSCSQVHVINHDKLFKLSQKLWTDKTALKNDSILGLGGWYVEPMGGSVLVSLGLFTSRVYLV